MAVGVFRPGVFRPGVFVPSTIFTLMFQSPSGSGGATLFGSTSTLDSDVNATRGPYGVDHIFALYNAAGLRLFGMQMIPDEITAGDLERLPILREVSPVAVQSIALGTDLINSWSTIEQPSMTVILTNEDKYWSKLLATEVLIFQPAGYFVYFGGGLMQMPLRGEIESVTITQERCTIRFGPG